MTFPSLSEAVADVEKLFGNIFAAHPEIETELSTAATETVAGLKDAATAAVSSANLPPAVSALVDSAIADTQAQIDALTTKLAGLQASKGAAQ